jgi:hypothetical protein
MTYGYLIFWIFPVSFEKMTDAANFSNVFHQLDICPGKRNPQRARLLPWIRKRHIQVSFIQLRKKLLPSQCQTFQPLNSRSSAAGPIHLVSRNGISFLTAASKPDHHQLRCQVSQAIEVAGGGSGSGSTQFGRHLPSGDRRTVQLLGAGSHRQTSSVKKGK